AAIRSALATVRSDRPVTLRFRGLGFFPDEKHPRVFWAGIEASPNLKTLSAAIDKATERLGIPREQRPFSPHLTLARFGSSGLPLAKLFGGMDVRKVGSGNIGATNVARVVGPLAGTLTLVFDTAKGAAAVWLAGRFTNESATWMMMAAIAVLLGHCFPIWIRFRGGKGVATALGVFLALCPLAAVVALLLFLLCVAYWRFVSLGSIAAAAAMPLLI